MIREPKGFAFVEFRSEREAEDARRNLDGVRIDGRDIRVVFAQERRKSTDQMRERERCGLPADPFELFALCGAISDSFVAAGRRSVEEDVALAQDRRGAVPLVAGRTRVHVTAGAQSVARRVRALQ
jgi:RNA recognition motif-containing protein